MRNASAILLGELKRRHLIKVSSVYLIAAWMVVQVIATLTDPLGMPDWVDTVVVLILTLGFPLILLVGWFVSVTPDGLRVHYRDDQALSGSVRLLASSLWIALAVASVLSALIITRHVGPAIDPFDGLVDVSEPVPGFSGRAAIAVLPFLNLSGDPAQSYFADGFTEDLITGLQSIQSFPVIARASTFQYKDHRLTIPEIAAQLGAGYIVDGSVRKFGDDVRINVEVSNDQGKQIWAHRYTFQFKDAIATQDGVVGSIIHAIEPKLILTEADRSRFVRTADMEAWDYYLQALPNTFAHFAFTNLNGQYITPERLEHARELLLKAVELDPRFASAYRLLNHVEGAYVFNLAHLLTEEEAKEKIRAALKYGEKARLISPFEPGVCSCQAAMLVMAGEVEKAYQLQVESLKHNPSNAAAHAMIGKILQMKGLYEEALQEIAVAKRLSPRSMAMTTFLYFEAATFLAMSRYEDAIKSAEKSLLLVPGNYDAAFIRLLALSATKPVKDIKPALAALHKIIPPGGKPSSGWGGPFPSGLADRIEFLYGADLAGATFNQGLVAVLDILGS